MKLVSEAVGRKIARNALLARRNSPGVLFGVGVVGMVGSTVLACRATLKMEEVLDEAAGKLKTARTLQHDDYSDFDRQRDIHIVRVQTGVKIVKLYSPAIIVGGLSIAALTSSHNILNKRNAALTAAYAALDKGFNEYRARVIDRYGEQIDRELRYGSETVEIEDPETGKKKKALRVAPGDPSIYARFFDDASPSWNKEPEYNFLFLKCQQNYANDMLHAKGHVFLNEVYDMLGIPRSREGAVVGWILSKNGTTDNFVNFGIFDDREVVRDFVNGREGAILLDFNVDGVIFDRIDTPMEGLSWQRER